MILISHFRPVYVVRGEMLVVSALITQFKT